MNFKCFLEALTISQWRDIGSSVKDVDFKNRYEYIFGNKNRIYIPFKIQPEDIKNMEKQYDDSNKEIIEQILNEYGYILKDYISGIAEKDGVSKKIGKVFTEIDKKIGMETFLKTIDQKPSAKRGRIKRILGYSMKEVMDSYSDDPLRGLAKIKDANLEIVISRHPYDIAGMSTGRGWTSCTDLEKGGYTKDNIVDEIKFGTLVAYLVKKEDKNINKPISRVLIKPYYNVKNEKDVYLKTTKIYGSNVKSFKDEVQSFIDKFQTDKKGMFHLPLDLIVDYGDVRKIKI